MSMTPRNRLAITLRDRSERSEDEDDSTTAVMAHGLLSSMAVIGWGVSTIQDKWGALDEVTAHEVLAMVQRQVEFVSGLLGDLARGMPPEALDVLSGGGAFTG